MASANDDDYVIAARRASIDRKRSVAALTQQTIVKNGLQSLINMRSSGSRGQARRPAGGSVIKPRYSGSDTINSATGHCNVSRAGRSDSQGKVRREVVTFQCVFTRVRSK